MKRLLALALIASLMSAPAVFAQPPAAPAKPTPAAPSGKTPAQPKKEDKPADKPKDDKKAADDDAGAAMQKAWEESAKTGPNHKLLEWFEGEWAAEVKDLTPGAETTDKGTQTNKMAMGGRFLMIDFDGRSHGKFFRGAGMWGYNNVEKRFESTWSDSMGTGITFMSGSADKDGKVFTLTGTMSDPTNPGGKSAMKEVTTITGKDSYRSDFYMSMGGKDVKAMEITYTKAKAAKKDDKADEKPKGK